jgi:hypothetical protein
MGRSENLGLSKQRKVEWVTGNEFHSKRLSKRTLASEVIFKASEKAWGC